MNEKTAKLYMTAILITALETEPNPFPETLAYLAIGGNEAEWYTIRNILDKTGLMTISRAHTCHLTDKGRDFARKLAEALKKGKEA